jgi:hypothetical protein
MRHALALIAPLMLTLLANGAAAGPWPRAQGTGFASVTPQIAGPQAADAQSPTTFGGLYAEFGAAPSWTVGFDAQQTGTQQHNWTGIAFARHHLWTSADGDVISAEMGLGYLSSPDDPARPRLRPGVSWGRGFASAWGNGWLSLDASAEFLTTAGDALLKAEFTAGIKTDGGLMLIMQLQTDRDEDGAIAARLAPSAVLRLSGGVQMQLSVAAGVVNDTSASVKLGTWLEF